MIRSRPKCEHLAAQHLAAAGYETFCPRIRHRKNTARGRVWFIEALFPGYLFSRFVAAASLRHVSSLPFVTQVLSFDHSPGAVPDSVIADLRREYSAAAAEKDTITVEAPISEGDEVEIVDGPLRGNRVKVTRLLPGRERVKVLLDFIGGAREVEVPLLVLLGCRDPRQEALRHRP